MRVANISRVFHGYLISSHKPVFIGLNYRCAGVTPQTERVILSTVVGYWPPAWEQQSNNHWSRIGCHNNFDKAKDALRVRGQFWNKMLMLFYLNVFYLPLLKDFVGLTNCGMR